MFPTDLSFPTLELELTNTVTNITITDPNFTDDYWLGWVNFDNLPISYHISSFVWDTTNDTTYLNDVTKPENVPIGYCSSYVNTDNANYDHGVILTYDTANTKWGAIRYTPANTSLPSNYCRLPNTLDVNTSQLGDELWIGIFFSVNGAANNNPTWVNVTITGMINDDDFTFTMGTYSVTKKLSDFNEHVFLEETDPDTGNVYKFCITAWRCSVNDPSVTTDGTAAVIYQKIHPMIRVHESITGENKPCIMGFRGDVNYGSKGIVQYDGYIRGLDQTIFESDVFNWIFGGFIGSFSISEWATYRQTGRVYRPDTAETFFLTATGTYQYGYIWRIITRDEIYKMCALQHRFTTVSPNVYSNSGQIYAKVDTETNEFLTEFVYGENFRELTNWQYIGGNTSDNFIDPDTIPDYNPGGDDENTGSDIIRPGSLGVGGTNGFITQYSLNASQVAEIGRLLWLSFTDPDYYKNFLFTLATTGTINLSNLLDYFISLRVYPFPMINVPSHASAGTDMYIGAGIIPLGFSSTLHTINNYADYIDAGTCTIPRYYNDFRDYTNTQILLYLPYCGTVQLNPADVVGGTLHAQYAIDFGSGGANAYVDILTHDGRQYPIAALSGSIGADIPLTATNAAQIAARIAGDALNFAGTVGDAVKSDVGRSAQAIGSAVVGDYLGAAKGVVDVYAGRIGGAVDIANTGLQILAGEGVKMPMLSGGRGFGSFGAPQTAYVQIRRGLYAEGQMPKQGFIAAHGEEFQQPVIVSSCTGFTTFTNVDTAGLSCSSEERAAIQSLMQSGIFI